MLCCNAQHTCLQVFTEDVVNFKPTKKWDRVVSIEMFEHMKNYQVGLVVGDSDMMQSGCFLL